MKGLILFFILLWVINIPVFATVINIPDDYPTIQEGINASTDGDTVLVAPDTYFENINFSGKNIVVASNFILDGDPAYIANTIIDGSQPRHPDTASCVLMVSGEDSSAMLIGFTLTGGRGTVWQDIHNHLWYREGGGVLIELSSPAIRNNIVTANEAIDDTGIQSAGGGGIRAGDGNPLIERNEISFNTGLYGGGIVLNYATGIIRNNLIYSNSGGEDYGGGGIWTYGGGETVIENNTIVGNSSVLDGGGLLIWSTSVIAQNNIIYENTDFYGYPQVRLRSGGTAEVTYCDIEGGWDGEGNIDCDPMFCDLEEGNFHLAENSCCVGAGENGEDIGAFGVGCEPTEIDEEQSIPSVLSLLQNYPNPFNASTLIEYSLPSASDITIEIYDILGRKVETLVQGEQQSGFHQIIWNAEDASSGMYFYRINAGEYTEAKKMLLLK
jgi:hypothetical protein